MVAEFDAAHRYQDRGFHSALTTHPTVVDAMHHWAQSRPTDVYVTTQGPDGVQSLTFAGLERQSRDLSAWMRRTLDLHQGDVVALLPQNDLRSVVAIFALLRAGCVIFVVHPDEPDERLAELLQAVGPVAVLAPSERVAERAQITTRIPDFGSLPEDSAHEPTIDPYATALLLGTSGSTATSKIVAQAHCNAAINAEALRRHHGLEPGSRVLGCLPIHHVNGLHFTLFATLWAGAQAVLLDSFRAHEYPRVLDAYRPHIASVVPSILESLLLTWRKPAMPSGFRHFVSAAAPLSARTCGAVHDKLGARVLQGYGLTETTNFSTTMPSGLSDEAYRRLMTDADIPSIGVALYGNDVAVLRPDGTVADPSEVGEICIRGHNVMLGYLDNDEATQSAFQDGWFHSQDVGYARIEGETKQPFFVITGRRKNMAKVMGTAVSFEEMERVLLRFPALRDAACFSVPDPLAGEVVVAAYVSPLAVEPQRLALHLRSHFLPTVIPRRFVQAESLPRTATGKLIRPRLAAMFAPPSPELQSP